MELDVILIAQAADSLSAGNGQDVLSEGVSIAIAGIVIVFTALMLITLFIASLPAILRAVNQFWPEVTDGLREPIQSDNQATDDTDVLAAIGFVLHTEFQKQIAAGDKQP